MDDERVRRIIQEASSVAVVGASARPTRPSHGVTRYLVEHTHLTVYPVNPNYDDVVGLPTYPSLEDLPEPPDIVDVFRNPEHLPEVVEDAIGVGARVLWTQLGVRHGEALERARQAGLEVVESRCLKVEHARLLG